MTFNEKDLLALLPEAVNTVNITESSSTEEKVQFYC